MKLGDICDIIMGQAPAGENYNETGEGYPLLAGAGDLGEITPQPKRYSKIATKLNQINDIVLCIRATIGTKNWGDKIYCLGRGVAAIRPKNETQTNINYIWHWLTANNDTLLKKAKGATFKQVTKQDIEELTCELPPLSEQNRITAILDKVDSIIRKRKQSIRLLDELVKAKFVEMFGDTKSNSKNLPLIELGDIADVRSSKRVYTTDFKGDGIPFYRGTEIGLLAENKDFNPELFISQKHYRSLCKAAGRPQIGDLLLPSICHDGRIWEIDTEKPFYFKDGRVLWVNSIKSCFDVTYLRYALKFRLIVDYDKFASGTTFSELKICTLKKCRIFAVSISKQKQFSSFAKKVESLSDENKRFIKGNYNLKYSLDSQFFR